MMKKEVKIIYRYDDYNYLITGMFFMHLAGIWGMYWAGLSWGIFETIVLSIFLAIYNKVHKKTYIEDVKKGRAK